ncbi:TonB-dependent receptor domain-containing protein [Aquimarina megaterium]|uniref:TonB-dependent receptor domain-containing protein n=1 Tax=Aquimarina megaterium TaxID=1443666 RepID=UPI000944B156|nr:TonB-dependent receptor [Aquimarina megaterium]
MNTSIKITLVFFLGILFSNAQNTILGTVTENTNSPLEFANIILHSSDISNSLTGAVSDNNGSYIFENVPAGNYWVEISILGFKTQKSEPFLLSKESVRKVVNFVLEEETQTLNEVVITSSRPVIRQTAEKLIVDLEKSEMVNSNLQDVMKKLPGVIVTNGKLSYGGQRNIRILINGKTTDYMDIASLLRDMPADNIAKIELVQQPGAQLDAEGSGPLINIILMKNVKLGTHGNIKLNTGYNNEFNYGASASLASYKNKLNWQMSTGYQKSTSREDLFLKRQVNNQIYDQATISPYDPTPFRVSGGLDYYINNHHSIGISARGIQTNSNRVASNNTSIIENDISNTLITAYNYDRERTIFSINPYYEFDTDNNTLVLDFNYINYKNKNIDNLYQVGQSSILYDNQRYFQDGNYEIFTYKGDYKRSFNDVFNVMVGAKYSVVDTDSDLRSFTEDSNQGFVLDIDQSNRFLVDENIIALYSKLDTKLGNWLLSGGLRWEDSNTKGTSTNTNETQTRNISKLFPSATITRKLTEEFSANLSYSYRIRRPSYNSLNSFVYYYDPYTFEEGNPNLKPEFTNSFQFSLTYDEQPFFSVSYKETTDVLFEITSQNDATGQAKRSVINLAKNENWSFRAFGPLNFIKGLDGFTGVIVSHNKYTSKNLTPKLDLARWNLIWYTSAQLKLPWGINSELTGYYSTSGVDGQFKHEWLAGLNVAVSKKFMKDQLKVNMGMNDILNRPINGVVKYDNINAEAIVDQSRQNVYLQLSYSFGSKFSRKKSRKEASKEEQNRIKDNN